MAILMLALVACNGASDGLSLQPTPETDPVSESQLLREKFGPGQDFFTDEGMQGLLDFEDQASPVVLLQLISVTDSQGFSAYETEAEALWESVGAGTKFASKMFAQLIGDRELLEARAIEFPNIAMLLQVMNTVEFSESMETLFAVSDDHAWVLGIETVLPFEPSGSYFDPALQNVDREQALEMLQLGADSKFDANVEAVIQMLISDNPGPFWMVNLIDLYDQANYADGRESDLTGAEANEIYGRAIFPTLSAYNSLPELLMPVAVVLTTEPADWEQAAIVRYASRDAFLNIFPLNPHASDALEHKEAGVENTLVYASESISESVPEPKDGVLYNFRYCEVLLFSIGGEELRADVYNSMGFGNCPQEAWDALEAQAIAEEFDADLAALNGIRFWVLDLIEPTAVNTTPPRVEQFGDITMRLVASVVLPSGTDLTGQGEISYRVNKVSRNTIFHYSAGRQVYELQHPDGRRYMMQSFTRKIDTDQQLEDLQFLGGRLDLPPGWTFTVRILEQGFQLETVEGIAEVITDNLNNTYQLVP